MKDSRIILGIHCGYSHDSGVAVLKDGKILGCLAQERVSRIKKDAAFPFEAITKLLQYIKMDYKVVDEVALGAKDIQYMPGKFVERYLTTGISFFMHHCPKTKIDELRYTFNKILGVTPFTDIVLEKLKQIGFREDIQIRYIDHHDAHLASVLYTAGLLEDVESYIIVIDAYGDGKAVSAYHYLPGREIEVIYTDPAVNSTPGQVYSQVTEYLGMIANRHEGKVTGLAAYGKRFDPGQYKKLICFDATRRTFAKRESFLARFSRRIKGYGYYAWVMKQYFEGMLQEDVASITQAVFENEIKKFLKTVIPTGFKGNILLAGGVFANVCLNYRVAEMFPSAPVYIHPGMSDEGIGLGAALWAAGAADKLMPKIKLNDVYFGTSYNSSEVERILHWEDLSFCHRENRQGGFEKLIAELIDFGAVVGLFDGRMEYGPRALGNRSILVQPRDRSINHSLNARLRRTEYMPFAPVVMEERADEVFVIPDNLRIPLKYMTAIVYVREEWKKRVAGITHVDGTVRPQTISRETNPFYYDIINEFYKITGIPLVVNTSFNLHEEPIIESVGDALGALRQGAIDVLCFKDLILVEKEFWHFFMHRYRLLGSGTKI